MNILEIPVNDLHPYEKNAKKHPEDQVQHIANSLQKFGWKQPLVIDKDNVVVVGHGRLLAAKKLGMEKVPCVVADDLTEDEIKAFRLADNKTNESEWDEELLDLELEELEPLEDIDMADFGFEIKDGGYEPEEPLKGSLDEAFLVTPFSVLCGDSGKWLDRKRAWLETGIRSSMGRGGNLTFSMPDTMQRQHRG